jgi:uncharacterized membrane protein
MLTYIQSFESSEPNKWKGNAMKNLIEIVYIFSLLGAVGGMIFFFVPLGFGIMAIKENVWDNLVREGLHFRHWQCIWVGPLETVVWACFPVCTVVFWTMTICGYRFIP